MDCIISFRLQLGSPVFVFLHPGSWFFAAQGDIIMSLQSRLDIICDEAEGDSASNIDGGGGEASDEISTEKPVAKLVLQLLRKGCSLPLPRRVYAPWLAGIYVRDYLQPSETVEACSCWACPCLAIMLGFALLVLKG
ncbi:hypothetical protein K1719_022159 [Acacia pycnantha]|nr:hypothetical protein K1719_022159 [Acacia pycnantha]